MTVAAPPAEDLKLVQFARRATVECRSDEDTVRRFETDILVPLREWCVARADRVLAAYVCPPDCGVMSIYIVGRGVRWDSELAAEASDTRFPFRDHGWRTLCGYLPGPTEGGDLNTFFDPATALVAYANG